MRYVLYLALAVVFMPAFGRDENSRKVYRYESVDGFMELIVSGDYYYLGPVNHPKVPNFVEEYGEKIQYVQTRDGTCLSLNLVKLAKFDSGNSVCDNTRIFRSGNVRDHAVTDYEGICSVFARVGCSPAISKNRRDFEYGYRIEGGRGIVEIYFSNKEDRHISNTFMLKTEIGLLN